MRQLIINADDLGCNMQRSHGIFLCAEFGIVTSATIWPNGSDSMSAAKHALEKGLDVGLHLNLVEEYPLSNPDDVASLLSSRGTFQGVQKLFALLDAGAIPSEHLEREVRAQIEWCFDQGITPTHIAGNWDAHVHPAIATVMVPLMLRYGIRFVRIPCEEPLPPFGFEVPETQLADINAINTLALAARPIFEAEGIGCADHFRGHTLLGNASLKNLRHIIGRLPEGITELMVHPGSQNAFGTPFDLDPQRQTELNMLTELAIKEDLDERKIELISYADL